MCIRDSNKEADHIDDDAEAHFHHWQAGTDDAKADDFDDKETDDFNDEGPNYFNDEATGNHHHDNLRGWHLTKQKAGPLRRAGFLDRGESRPQECGS